MTRRERHERIIDWFTDRSREWELQPLLRRHGLSAFTDEFIEEFASALVKSEKRQQAMNRRNREVLAARGATP